MKSFPAALERTNGPLHHLYFSSFLHLLKYLELLVCLCLSSLNSQLFKGNDNVIFILLSSPVSSTVVSPNTYYLNEWIDEGMNSWVNV